MSYDICLKDPVARETIELDAPHQMRSIRVIYGLTGAKSIILLREVIACVERYHPKMETDSNDWHSCAGNTVKPLYQLIALAQLRPDGVWEGD